MRVAAAHRGAVSLVFDLVVWALAVAGAGLLRYDFAVTEQSWMALAWLLVAIAAGQLLIGAVQGLYRGRFVTGSFEELVGVTRTVLGVGVLTGLAYGLFWPQPGVPRSVPFVAAGLALVVMAGARGVFRTVRDRRRRPGPTATPTLVAGAGRVGSQLVRQMMGDSVSPWRPVALLDDDPDKARLRLTGVPVRGRWSDLARVARETGASTVVLAVAGADSALIREMGARCREAGVELKVLPQLSGMLADRVRLSDVQDVGVEDILGRHQVDTDVAAIAGYVRGRRVLVTGAGGSIGSELCRQLHRFEPAELVLLDRDESALHGVVLSISGQGTLDTPDVVLCDIRDADAVQEVFAQARPEVVFHAAALKHLPLLERYPEEAWKTNVVGTDNVLRAARAVGATHVVNVSTDKAAQPSSVLGRSKRAAEQLTAHAAAAEAPRGSAAPGGYLSVRFGNVLGSRGSVLHTFRAQIDRGGPVTVTDLEVTRYFMTIPEACQLIVQAGAIGRSGEVLVLDMGDPVRIIDIARRMVELSGRDIEIVSTGLRPGEKLHETLFSGSEPSARPVHPLISHVAVPPLGLDQLGGAVSLLAARPAGDAPIPPMRGTGVRP